MRDCKRCGAEIFNGTVCVVCGADSKSEIEESVIEQIRKRRDIGRKKYGVTMERKDLSKLQWLRHAQEEALDLAIYLEKCIQEQQNGD